MENQTKYTKELNERKIEPFYLIVSVVKIELYLTDNSRTSCYVIFGNNSTGKRKYITSVEDVEGKKVSDWYDILQVLKKRGLKTMVYVTMPNDKSLRDALKLAFKDVEIYESCEVLLDRMKKYMPRKEYEPMIPKLKGIYISPTIDEYKIKREEFKKRYVTTELYKDIVGTSLDDAEKIYNQIPYKTRFFMYSFYGSNRMYVRFKGKNLSKKYKSLNEYIESYGEIIKAYESEMSTRRKEWGEIMNEVYQIKKELIQEYI